MDEKLMFDEFERMSRGPLLRSRALWLGGAAVVVSAVLFVEPFHVAERDDNSNETISSVYQPETQPDPPAGRSGPAGRTGMSGVTIQAPGR